LALTAYLLASHLIGKAHAAQEKYLKYCAAEGAKTATCHALLVATVSYKPTTGAVVSTVAMLAVSTFFFLSLMLLFYVQTRNLISGKTTAERYG
jgi:predicted membrane-bound dolichyl-phosphate-mannose-protein mannosyltransferase